MEKEKTLIVIFLYNFNKIEPIYAIKTEGSAEYANALNINRFGNFIQ